MEEIREEILNNDTLARWAVLAQQWDSRLSQVDALLVRDGVEDEEVIKLKTIAVQEWLFRFEFINSILVIGRERMVFYGNADKIKLFQLATESAAKSGKKVSVVEKSEPVSPDEVKRLFAEIGQLEAKSFGVFSREKQKGKMVETFDEEFRSAGFEEVDVSTAVQEIMSVKLPADLRLLETACRVTSYFFGQFVNTLETVIDDNSRLAHSEISRQLEDMLVKSKGAIERKFGVRAQFFDYAYSPIVQSGGEYDLRPNAENTDSRLSHDCILLNMSGKYLGLICNVFRTLMINPGEEDKNNYKALLDIHRRVIRSVKAGRVLNTVYEEGAQYARETYPHLADKLPINFGFGIGYEFKESCLLINRKNTRKVESGNAFTVITSLRDLTGFRGKKYCLHLSDTLYVDKEGAPVNLTGSVPCDFEDIGYNIEEDEQPAEKHRAEPKTSTGFKTRSAKRGQQLAEEHARAERMRVHQKELMSAKMAELEERVRSGNFIVRPSQSSKLIVEKLQTYAGESRPPSLPKNSIHVDAKSNAVLLPIGKELVPFHIACIKNVTKHSENNQALLRINFQTPAISSSHIVFPTVSSFGAQPLYVKELTVTSRNPDNLSTVAKQVKELQKKYKLSYNLAAKQVKENERVPLRNKLKTLGDVKMRPTLAGKKTTGSLTSFTNGFKFVSSRSEVFEVMLSNVKHAFFQPADEDMVVILHLYLFNPVVVNKKLTNHVQFFTEVGAATEDLADPRRRRRADYDEYEEEQLEEQARERFNKLYLDFCEYTEKNWESDLQFEQPFADLGFYGSYASNNVFIAPSAHCLVSLLESPFLVVTLDEVEIVSFERLDNKIKNFDMVVIFKDYATSLTISNIPKTNLDVIKEWLE